MKPAAPTLALTILASLILCPSAFAQETWSNWIVTNDPNIMYAYRVEGWHFGNIKFLSKFHGSLKWTVRCYHGFTPRPVRLHFVPVWSGSVTVNDSGESMSEQFTPCFDGQEFIVGPDSVDVSITTTGTEN